MSSNYEIIIIGGGIVGLGVFHQLTLNGYQNVLLLEKSSQILTGASSGNSGILHTGFDTIPGTLESRLVQRGYQLYQQFAREIELPMRKIGACLIAWKDTDVEVLQQILDTAHQNGVFDIEEISAVTLYDREPLLRRGALRALCIPGESIVDPLTIPLILLMHGQILGGHVQTDTEVTSGTFDRERKCWKLNDGQFTSKIVINCAGLFGDMVEQIRIDQQPPTTPPFTIRPRIGQFSIYSFPATASPPINSIILPIPTKFTKGVIVYPNLFKQMVVGPTAETQEDRSQAPIQSAVSQMLHEKVSELIPSFSTLQYERVGSYTGIRPATEHADYQIDAYDEWQWICCGGIRSTGLTSSLAIGEYVCQKFNDLHNIKNALCSEGFSSARYHRSLQQLKTMFIQTSLGLQPKLVAKEMRSPLSSPSTGNVEFSDDVDICSLQIECNGALYDISHSLLKLAWMTKGSA